MQQRCSYIYLEFLLCSPLCLHLWFWSPLDSFDPARIPAAASSLHWSWGLVPSHFQQPSLPSIRFPASPRQTPFRFSFSCFREGPADTPSLPVSWIPCALSVAFRESR